MKRKGTVAVIFFALSSAVFAVDDPPVCRGTPDTSTLIVIEGTATDDGTNPGIGGVSLTTDSTNLSLGSGHAPSFSAQVSPVDADLDGKGALRFSDVAAPPQTCDVGVGFFKDGTTLCDSGSVFASLLQEQGRLACDVGYFAGATCTADVDCEVRCLLASNTCFGGPDNGQFCDDVVTFCTPDDGVCSDPTAQYGGTCAGGFNDQAKCQDEVDCQVQCVGFCVGGPDDGDPCDGRNPCSVECAGTCAGGPSDGFLCDQFTPCIPDDGTCPETCKAGANDGLPCATDLQCPDGRCTRGTAECAANVFTGDEPPLPPGYTQPSDCPILTLRISDLGGSGNSLIELAKGGGFNPNLRLLISEFDGVSGVDGFPPFRDATVEVEQVCTGTATPGGGFAFHGGVDDDGVRDKGLPDLRCTNMSPLLRGPVIPPFPAQVKLTCAVFTGVDCSGGGLDGFDGDGDNVPVCDFGVPVDCNDANRLIFPAFAAAPAAPEICNGLDDNCDLTIDEGFNPDGDILADCFDCAPGDNTSWSAPVAGIGTTLLLEHEANPNAFPTPDRDTTLSWSALTDACAGGTTYETIRSNDAADFTPSTCSIGVGASSIDSVDPSVGMVRYFLVRASNVCGVGPVETRSDGTRRTVTCL